MLKIGDTLYFVPPVIDAPRSSSIDSIEFSDDSARVSFSTIESVEQAELLVGCTCLIDDHELSGRTSPDAIAIGESSIDIGWTLNDQTTDRAFRIDGVLDYPSQKMAVVTELDLNGSATNEKMIPLVDDLIIEIDDSNKTILMRLPKGILEL